MRRLAVVVSLILCGLLAPASMAAQARPTPIVRQAIQRWWKGARPVTILWCSTKRYGTLCGLQAISRKDGARVREWDHVWVRRVDGHVRDLWAVVWIRASYAGETVLIRARYKFA